MVIAKYKPREPRPAPREPQTSAPARHESSRQGPTVRLSLSQLEQLYRTQAQAIDAGLSPILASTGAFTATLPPELAAALERGAHAGQPLSQTLRALRVVDAADAALLAAAEARGGGASTLVRLADRTADRQSDRRRLLQGLLYPGLLLVVSLIVPPLPLLVTEGTSGYLRATLPPLATLLALALVVVLVQRQAPDSPARRALDAVLQRVPPVSLIVRAHARARYVDVLGACVAAGLDLRTALGWASAAAEHPALGPASRPIARLDAGATLHEALAELPGVESLDRALIGQGELAGKLDEVLPRVAAQHRERARTITRRTLMAVIALASVVVMGSAVRAIVAGYSGYFQQIERATGGR